MLTAQSAPTQIDTDPLWTRSDVFLQIFKNSNFTEITSVSSSDSSHDSRMFSPSLWTFSIHRRWHRIWRRRRFVMVLILRLRDERRGIFIIDPTHGGVFSCRLSQELKRHLTTVVSTLCRWSLLWCWPHLRLEERHQHCRPSSFTRGGRGNRKWRGTGGPFWPSADGTKACYWPLRDQRRWRWWVTNAKHQVKVGFMSWRKKKDRLKCSLWK